MHTEIMTVQKLKSLQKFILRKQIKHMKK